MADVTILNEEAFSRAWNRREMNNVLETVSRIICKWAGAEANPLLGGMSWLQKYRL